MDLRNQGRCIESFLACVRKTILIFARYFPTSPDWQRLSRKVCSSTSLAESGPSERQRGRKVVFSNVTTQGRPGQGWWPILQRPATSQSQHSQSSVSVSHLVSVCVMETWRKCLSWHQDSISSVDWWTWGGWSGPRPARGSDSPRQSSV